MADEEGLDRGEGVVDGRLAATPAFRARCGEGVHLQGGYGGEVGGGEEQAEEGNKWLETPIEDVDFSVRTFNCLKKEAINALGELVKHSEGDLLAIRNFGKRSLEEVIQKLAQFDLSLVEPGGEDIQ